MISAVQQITVPMEGAEIPQPSGTPKRISILGATGSVGENTLDLVRRNPDAFDVVGLTANGNAERLGQLALEFGAEYAAVAEEGAYEDLKQRLSGSNTKVGAGESGILEAASAPVDWTMAAIVGIAGLKPTLAAIKQGATIALANKECLVSAGSLFIRAIKASGGTLLPVDSEHSAAFQAIDRSGPENIERITLTASGGPFRTWSAERIAAATSQEALAHPNWSMGPKITIDSATLMNKGLELIEAYHLFPVSRDQLDVVVHPQSIVHCLVSYRDGSVIAQLGEPDMRSPIAFSLAWPNRMKTPVERLDLAKLGRLDFEPPDEHRFPCLRIARQAMAKGACTVLNAANEIAVMAFLEGRIRFSGISEVVEGAIESADRQGLLGGCATIDAVFDVDHEARRLARALLNR